jgi:xylulokinase
MVDLASAAEQLVKTDKVFLPDPKQAHLAERRFHLWQDLISQTRTVNAALAGQDVVA